MWLPCSASCVTLIDGPCHSTTGRQSKGPYGFSTPLNLTSQPLQELPGKKSLGHTISHPLLPTSLFFSPPGTWKQGTFSYSLFDQDTPQGHILSPLEMAPAVLSPS